MDSHFARPLHDNAEAILVDIRNLRTYVVDLKPVEPRYLVESISGAGSHTKTLPDDSQRFVWWNPEATDGFAVAIAEREEWMWNEANANADDRSGSHVWSPKSHHSKFRMRTNYFGLGEFVEDGIPDGAAWSILKLMGRFDPVSGGRASRPPDPNMRTRRPQFNPAPIEERRNEARDIKRSADA